MEIKKGMYVRLLNNHSLGIGKINDKVDENWYSVKFKNSELEIPVHFISKASFDIVDLLEEGDYVNGHLVIDKYKDCDDKGNDYINVVIENKSMINKGIKNEEIKNIVTKEQFKEMVFELC